MQLIDLSHLIVENMPVYPGTSGPRFVNTGTVPEDGYAERMITMQSHTGTHVDSPAHMIKNGATLDSFKLDRFFGKALLLDCLGLPEIDHLHLNPHQSRLAGCDFIVLYTGWSKYWGQEKYYTGFPVLTPQAVQWVSRLKLKGIGVDTISVDSAESTTFPVHKTLLGRNMLVIENLNNLDRVKQNVFTLCCFPLKIYKADGSPVRAAAIID
jgi:arylformamidase